MNKPVVVTEDHRLVIRMTVDGKMLVLHLTGNATHQQAWGPYPVLVVMGVLLSGNWRSLCPSLPFSARLRETVVHFDVAVR